jgi:hypothetical protein
LGLGLLSKRFLRLRASGFRVWGFGFGASNSEFTVFCLGIRDTQLQSRVLVKGLEFRIQS